MKTSIKYNNGVVFEAQLPYSPSMYMKQRIQMNMQQRIRMNANEDLQINEETLILHLVTDYKPSFDEMKELNKVLRRCVKKAYDGDTAMKGLASILKPLYIFILCFVFFSFTSPHEAHEHTHCLHYTDLQNENEWLRSENKKLWAAYKRSCEIIDKLNGVIKK